MSETPEMFSVIENLNKEFSDLQKVNDKQEAIIKRLTEELKKNEIKVKLYQEVLPHLECYVNEAGISAFRDETYFHELQGEDFEEIFMIIYNHYEDIRYDIYEEFLHMSKIDSDGVSWGSADTEWFIVSEEYLRNHYVELNAESESENPEDNTASKEDCITIIQSYLIDIHDWRIVEVPGVEDEYYINECDY